MSKSMLYILEGLLGYHSHIGFHVPAMDTVVIMKHNKRHVAAMNELLDLRLIVLCYERTDYFTVRAAGKSI